MKPTFNFRLLSLSIFAAQFVAQPVMAFTYPTKPTLKFAPDNINIDLFKFHELEMDRIRVQLPKNQSMVDRSAALSAGVQRQNRGLLELLEANSVADPKEKVGAISQAQATSVLQALTKNSVVGTETMQKKSNLTRDAGFCFGRAVFVHLELLRRGVSPSAIAKLFAIGRIRHNGETWQYSVVTIVKGIEGGWWVIDDVGAEVVEVKDWMQHALEWGRKPTQPRLQFYLADAVKFKPIPGGYGKEIFEDLKYKTFFADLGAWFDQHPVNSSNKLY